MGIPSYYKRLIDRFPRLVTKGVAAAASRQRADVLLMDFNCLIYQCVRGEGVPVYKAEERDAWESVLLEAVKRYTVKVWEAAGRPGEVFIAVDGVVPMAKIRQQRLRRFKSLWWAAAEAEAGIRSGESWDTNAITPGTEFMEKLAVALRGLAAARSSGGSAGWTVSAADEPGEGEQKLMAWVRERSEAPTTGSCSLAGKRVVVYGLDADLIVLSLLTLTRNAPCVAGWDLLRELAEFEGGRGAPGAAPGSPESFATLDIKELLKLLVPSGLTAAEYMLEYTCGMSFLGNDFLPHSLSVKMREGGHDLLCRTLTELHTRGLRLVDSTTGKLNLAAAQALVEAWAVHEEDWLAENLKGKYKMRQPPPRSDKERAMVRVQNLPLEWREEDCVLGAGWTGDSGLLEDWRETYQRRWLKEAGAGAAEREYMRGLQWILDYYLGKPVSYAWYFPWSVPPLWSNLAAAFGAGEVTMPVVTSPVAPQEQLAMVLPLGSWWLVRDKALRTLPERAPVYWPQTFGFFSAGRRWMWECEAEIPILTYNRLYRLLEAA